MVFESFPGWDYSVRMDETTILSDFAKYDFLFWIGGGLCTLVFVIKNLIAIWQMLQGKGSDFVTRIEHRALRERIDKIEQNQAHFVTKAELAALKEYITSSHNDIKADLKANRATLQTLLQQVGRMTPFKY